MSPRGAPAAGLVGLTSGEARLRLDEHGPNLLVPGRDRPALFALLARALADPMTLLLLVAAPTYLLLRDYADAAVVLAALVPITGVSLVLERRAERALEQLSALTARTATVWRDGEPVTMPAAELVPGDLVEVREGDVVPADGVLVEGLQVMIDESALTGESQPVAKSGEAQGEVWGGTTVLSGRAVVRLTVTGPATRYGQIGTLVAGIREPRTPLQQAVRRLVVRLSAIAALFCAGVLSIELARGRGWGTAVIAAVSLAIATIPEEFPLVYTLYLALGARQLARQHALVRRLAAVETLGSTTVICADKTGTLTLGHVEVAVVVTADGHPHEGDSRARVDSPTLELLRAAVLASEPDPFDPLEQAIVRFAARNGVEARELHQGDLVRDYAFDPAGKYLSHVWRHGDAMAIFAKGALEDMLERTRAPRETRARAASANRALADRGMRVIAVAAGDVPALGADRRSDERHLQFAGLLAFRDPLRPGVADALRECGDAGIRVVMITGDHPVTAHAVAEGLGLPHDDDRVATGDQLDQADDATVTGLVRDCNVFARTRPEQKHRLVQALRAQGEIVAMTGDGINDAPALREADIGVALGVRGTEVAREAATLVLLDDNFATIVGAVRNGRRIFENLQRAFSYLVTFHVPLLLAALLVPLSGRPLLLLPVHLILLQLIVHPTVSLVFEHDPPAADLMHRPPRPRGAALFGRRELPWSLARGASLTAAMLALYVVRLDQGASVAQARGIALATLLVGQTALVIAESAVSRAGWAVMRANRVLGAVVAVTVGLLVATFTVPPLRDLLHVAPLSFPEWGTAIVTGLAATLWPQPFIARR
jgi:P-type Ca2+ transporter type 2C